MRLSTRQSLLLASLPLTLLAPAPGCGGKDAGTTASPGSVATVKVGTTGGSIVSSDGRLELSLPASAIAQAQTVTISETSIPGAVGVAYDIEPASLTLSAPVTLVLHYAGIADSSSASSIRIGNYVGGRWQALTGYALDTRAQTVTATTKHFGSFGGTQQAQVCIALSGTYTCAVSPGSGSSSGSSSGGGSSTSGSGGTSFGGSSSGGSTSGGSTSGGGLTASPDPSCPVPSCEELDPCSAYPTANSTSCSIDAQGNYTATCCYDPDVPYCWSFGGGGCGGGTSPSGSSGGSSGAPTSSGGSSSGSSSSGSSSSSGGSTSSSGAAPTTPPVDCSSGLTCASQTCGDPNATITSCTESSGANYASFSATCCYPPGVMPDNPTSSGSSSGGGSGSSSGSSSGSTGWSGSGSTVVDAGTSTNSGGSDNGSGPPGASSSSSGG